MSGGLNSHRQISRLGLSGFIFANLKRERGRSEHARKGSDMQRLGYTLIGLLFPAVISVTSAADGWGCPASALADPSHSKLISYLKTVQGKYPLGHCQIEIHACDPQQPATQDSELVADALIKDGKGRQIYIPFYAPNPKAGTAQQFQFLNNDSLRYTFIDRLYNPAVSQKGSWQIDFIRNRQNRRAALVAMEIGRDTTGDRRFCSGVDCLDYDVAICAAETHSWMDKVPAIFLKSHWWYWFTYGPSGDGDF